MTDAEIQTHLNAGRVWPNFREGVESHKKWGKRQSWKEQNALDKRQYGALGANQTVYEANWYYPNGFLIVTIRLPLLNSEQWETSEIIRMVHDAVQTDLDHLSNHAVSAAYKEVFTLEKDFLNKRAGLVNRLREAFHSGLSGKDARKHLEIDCDYTQNPNALLTCLWQRYVALENSGEQGWSNIVESWNYVFGLYEEGKDKLESSRNDLKATINRRKVLMEFSAGLKSCMSQSDYCLFSRRDVTPRWNLAPLAVATAMVFWLSAVLLYRK